MLLVPGGRCDVVGKVSLEMEFPNRGRGLWVGLILILVAGAQASEVKLENGSIYSDVTILSRTSESIELRVAYGTIKVPMKTVASIDGVPVREPAKPSDTPAAAATPLVTSVDAPIPAVPTPAPVITPAPVTVAAPTAATVVVPVTPSVPPAGENQTKPGPAKDPAADTDGPPVPVLWPESPYLWNMEAVLIGFALLSALWLGSVSWIQRDLFIRRRDPRFWTNLAIVLPGLGWLLYLFARQIDRALQKRKAKKAPKNVNEAVAERERAWVKRTGSARKGFEFLDQDRRAVVIRNSGEQSGIEAGQEVLEEALMERASDVHIEPAEDGYRVRFRIDGIMHPRMTFDLGEGQRLVASLKTLAQIDVAEKRKAQDGRFRVRSGEADVDFRVATANSIFGEKLVIRILDRKAGLLGLGELGMPDAMREEFARVIHSRSGMILATGPTGSGKTSTLYSALSQIDATRLNITTIEDPVEYELGGATQIPVNVRAGVTYESGLRSLLRQDPDVIFVGEMRDLEAAQIALRAALTGHLLFSSLHTKDAIGTIIRLEEMGIERSQLASALLMVIAQRLVRVLCPVCREPYSCTGAELRDIGVELPAGGTIYRAKGCADCIETGYVGRTGIFEMLVFDEDLRGAVSAGLSEAAISTLATSKQFQGYRQDGARKILAGVTSVEEVLQAT